MPAHGVRNNQEVYSRVSHEGTGRVFHTRRIRRSPTTPKEVGSWGTLHPRKVLQGTAKALEPALTNISVLPASTHLVPWSCWKGWEALTAVLSTPTCILCQSNPSLSCSLAVFLKESEDILLEMDVVLALGVTAPFNSITSMT